MWWHKGCVWFLFHLASVFVVVDGGRSVWYFILYEVSCDQIRLKLKPVQSVRLVSIGWNKSLRLRNSGSVVCLEVWRWCCLGVFGVLTSRSHPSSPQGWWAARGHYGSCAGSGRSAATRSTAASCGRVCCTRETRSLRGTGPRIYSTAPGQHQRSENK